MIPRNAFARIPPCSPESKLEFFIRLRPVPAESCLYPVPSRNPFNRTVENLRMDCVLSGLECFFIWEKHFVVEVSQEIIGVLVHGF